MNCPFCKLYESTKEEILYENDYFFSILNIRSGNPGDSMIIAKPEIREFDIHNCDLRVMLSNANFSFALRDCIIQTQTFLEDNIGLRRERYEEEYRKTSDSKEKEKLEKILKSAQIDIKIVPGSWEYR